MRQVNSGASLDALPPVLRQVGPAERISILETLRNSEPKTGKKRPWQKEVSHRQR